MTAVVAHLVTITQRPVALARRIPAGTAMLDAVGMGALAALIVAGFCSV